MKRLLFTIGLLFSVHLASAFTHRSLVQDTVRTQDTIKTDEDSAAFSMKLEDLSVGKKDNEEKEDKYPRIYGGITFSRIDWGFSRLLDNGSFTLSSENQEVLDYSKASNFGFDVAQFGLRFNDNFKIYTAAGFEWNYLRLENNVLLHENESPLAYTVIDRDEVNYKKNVLTSTYLRVPLTFEWRSDRLRKGRRFKVAAGPMFGILLKGTQRLKSDANGKQKFRDNYNLQSFQYGGVLRIGFGDLGVFAKYYMNDMFEKSPAQEGLNNFVFGLTLGF